MFAQSTLKDQLFDLLVPATTDEQPIEEASQPTYAQFASATGAFVIAAAASGHAIVRRRALQRERRRRGQHNVDPLQDTAPVPLIETEEAGCSRR